MKMWNLGAILIPIESKTWQGDSSFKCMKGKEGIAPMKILSRTVHCQTEKDISR